MAHHHHEYDHRGSSITWHSCCGFLRPALKGYYSVRGMPTLSTSFSAQSSSRPSFRNYSFVEALFRAYCEATSTRPTQVVAQFVGAQTTANYVEEQLLFSETTPLWNTQTHSDGLSEVRLAIARSVDVTLSDYDLDLAGGILVDLLVDALALAVRLSFTPIQAQHLLLIIWETHTDVVEIPFQRPRDGVDSQLDDQAAPSDADALEGVVARRLTKRLGAASSRMPTACVETRSVREVSLQEKIDPAALAAWEAKRADPKTNKKQLQALDEAFKTLPKSMAEVVTERQVEVETMVDIGPIFSYEDLAHIMQFVSETLLSHWRLYRYCHTTPRAVAEKAIHVVIQDVPPHFALPPLASALCERDYLALCDREAVWDEAEAAIESSFAELYATPMHHLLTVVKQALVEQQAREHEAMRLDRQAAMPNDEFASAVDVLTRRLLKRAQHATGMNTYVAPPRPPQSHVTTPAQTVAASSPQKLSTNGVAGGAVTPPSAGRKPTASAPVTPKPISASSAPPQPPLLDSAANFSADTSQAPPSIPDKFSFDEVDHKLNALHDAFNKAFAAAPQPPGKQGRK